MNKLLRSLLIGSMLVTGLAVNAQAGVINYTLPDVTNYNYARDDHIYNWFSTDVITDEVESFTLNFNWRDQGWGNRKGRIYYSSGDSGWQYLGVLAEHTWTSISKTIFSTSAADFDVAPINFGYVVGGGGGHRLYIRNASLSIMTAVPEPGSLVLLGLGIAGLIFSRRKTKRTVKAKI